MRPFRLVELQRVGKGLEDTVGDTAEVAPLQPDVVLDAHSGEEGHLLAAESLDPTIPAPSRQAGLLWGDPSPTRHQEVPNLLLDVHDQGRTSDLIARRSSMAA